MHNVHGVMLSSRLDIKSALQSNPGKKLIYIYYNSSLQLILAEICLKFGVVLEIRTIVETRPGQLHPQ